MNRLKGKTAFITGATSGIGKAIAFHLAEMGVHLIIAGRRTERLQEINQEIIKTYGVSCESLQFDIRNLDQVTKALESVDLSKVDILVNDAGLAIGTDPIFKSDLAEWDIMIDTNIKGLLYVSRLITPFMVQNKRGHILNMGSLAGHEAYPGGVAYNATKFAITGINKAMKMDLHGTGIRVSMLSPGMVQTEFSTIRFRGDQEKADSVYKGVVPLTADDIAEIAVFTLNRPDHVNISDSVVLAIAQSSATMVFREA